jgi:hypothetical protein
MQNYIPRNDAAFNVWQGVLVSAIRAKYTIFGVPPEEMTKLEAIQARWATAYEVSENPATRTKGTVRERQEIRQEYESEIRIVVKAYITYNPFVTDKEREDMGLPVHDKSHTSVPVPTTRPELDIDVVDFRRLKVEFRDMGSASKARPYGVNGAVIVYAVLETPPAEISDLSRSVLATRTPHTFEFTEGERGKTVYVAICWQNSKGQRGPWSEIESAIIP